VNLFERMFPYYVSGKIVAGFGRGSTQLGFPTGWTHPLCRTSHRVAECCRRHNLGPATNCFN